MRGVESWRAVALRAATAVAVAAAAAAVPAAATASAPVAAAPHRSLPVFAHGPARLGHGNQTWGGWAMTKGNPYDSISGTWTIPALDCSKGNGSVSPWIGIDGWANGTVEQIGVDLDCLAGKPVYRTWVEMYPKASVYFTETVKAGDVFAASVTVAGSSWTLSEGDAKQGWTKTFHYTRTDKLASAEAILEDLGSSGAPPVDDFGTETFRNLLVNGGPFASAGTANETVLERGTTPLAQVSPLQAKSFTITWLHR